MYFSGINNLTDLQLKRIELLQNCPDEAHEINSEFMKAKDLFIGTSTKSAVQVKKKIRRIEYKIEKCQDDEPYAELRGNTIYVSLPACSIFNAEHLAGQVKLPRVLTPATMAVFLPPAAPAPIFLFT